MYFGWISSFFFDAYSNKKGKYKGEKVIQPYNIVLKQKLTHTTHYILTRSLHDYGDDDDDRVLHISCCMIWLKKYYSCIHFLAWVTKKRRRRGKKKSKWLVTWDVKHTNMHIYNTIQTDFHKRRVHDRHVFFVVVERDYG